MAFHEIQFPTDISYGSTGGPGWNTNIITTQGGQESRTQRWAQPRRKYNVAYGVKDHTQLVTMRNFYVARRGASFGFRYKDFMDMTTGGLGIDSAFPDATPAAFDDELIGVGDGTTTVFQLIRTYADDFLPYAQNITKPVVGSVKSGIDGVEEVWGTDFSVDHTTGKVTYNVAPALGEQITGGCDYDIPVRFGKPTDELMALNIEDFSSGSVPAIEVIEEVDVEPGPFESLAGGSAEIVTSINISISMQTGRFILIQPNVTLIDVNLPPIADVPAGGPIFYLANNSGVNEFELRTDGGTLIETVGVKQGVLVFLNREFGSDSWLVT